MNEWMIERLEELKRKELAKWSDDDWMDYQYIENHKVQKEYYEAMEMLTYSDDSFEWEDERLMFDNEAEPL